MYVMTYMYQHRYEACQPRNIVFNCIAGASYGAAINDASEDSIAGPVSAAVQAHQRVFGLPSTATDCHHISSRSSSSNFQQQQQQQQQQLLPGMKQDEQHQQEHQSQIQLAMQLEKQLDASPTLQLFAGGLESSFSGLVTISLPLAAMCAWGIPPASQTLCTVMLQNGNSESSTLARTSSKDGGWLSKQFTLDSLGVGPCSTIMLHSALPLSPLVICIAAASQQQDRTSCATFDSITAAANTGGNGTAGAESRRLPTQHSPNTANPYSSGGSAYTALPGGNAAPTHTALSGESGRRKKRLRHVQELHDNTTEVLAQPGQSVNELAIPSDQRRRFQRQQQQQQQQQQMLPRNSSHSTQHKPSRLLPSSLTRRRPDQLLAFQRSESQVVTAAAPPAPATVPTRNPSRGLIAAPGLGHNEASGNASSTPGQQVTCGPTYKMHHHNTFLAMAPIY